MPDFVYPLLIIVVAALAVIRGYHKGLTGQVSSVVALCFGIICGHLFAVPVENLLNELFPHIARRLGGDCFLEMLSSGGVFMIIFMLLRFLLKILNLVGKAFYAGIINKLLGGIYCLIEYQLILSILLNLMASYNPGNSLVKLGTDRDGNAVEIVLKLAPAALGGSDIEDLGHKVQLEDAKKIS